MGRVSQARGARRTFHGEEQQVQRPRGKELNGIKCDRCQVVRYDRNVECQEGRWHGGC